MSDDEALTSRAKIVDLVREHHGEGPAAQLTRELQGDPVALAVQQLSADLSARLTELRVELREEMASSRRTTTILMVIMLMLNTAVIGVGASLQWGSVSLSTTPSAISLEVEPKPSVPVDEPEGEDAASSYLDTSSLLGVSPETM